MVVVKKYFGFQPWLLLNDGQRVWWEGETNFWLELLKISTNSFVLKAKIST